MVELYPFERHWRLPKAAFWHILGTLSRRSDASMKPNLSAKVNTNLKALLKARHHDPFAFLGLHQEGEGWSVRTFLPFEQQVEIYLGGKWLILEKIHPDGVFFWHGIEKPERPCRLRVPRNAGYH